MASECAICKKGSSVRGMTKLLRGHYNPTGSKKVKPNLQWVKLSVGKRVKACAKCIKKLHEKK
jgi:ribosomal protein L28